MTLADGRMYVFGGHDMQSNNGLFKVQIFDPETERWVRRARPCTRENWADATNRPATGLFPDCDPHELIGTPESTRTVTQPADPSDMKYARWYPTAIPLPNNTILIFGGPDQDATVLPNTSFDNVGASDAAFNASRTNQVVPEVYDPKTDHTIALENAPKTFPLYPQAEVVQFDRNGDGAFQRDDWKVCTMGGTERIASPFRAGDRYFGPFTGATWCLDVLAALEDPARGVRAAPADENRFWELLDTAAESRPYCCPTASFVELDRHGRTVSHRWYMISGTAAGRSTATIEVIDFADSVPRWRTAGALTHPNNTGKAVLLPDGTVFFNNGLGLAGTPFPERAGLRYQIYDPTTETTRAVALTTVPRGLHGTATLLPDATVFVAGENREALVRPDDPAFSDPANPLFLEGLRLERGDPDLGVPNGQVFRPPYLFNTNGSRAGRPVIRKAPDELDYRGHFDVEVTRASGTIASVVLLRSDHNTHQLTTGDRHVKLAFERKDKGRRERLRVVAPRQPAQAVPGIYMLFVLDETGVPSVAKQVRLMPEKRGERHHDGDEDDD
ncbi:MAG: galactose oxidase-like domain-containing protein [Gammaproteobacteria bacterium]